MRSVLSIVFVVLLLATACAGETAVVETGTSAETAMALDLDQVAPDLVYLGELAEVTSSRSQVFDNTGGTLELSSDSVVEVPAGAFASSMELRVAEIELVLDRYATGAPRTRIYRLSTTGDVALGEPVVLEVAAAPETVAVIHLVDGVWQPVAVEDGTTTRVVIDHFSDVTIAVGERIEGKPIMNTVPDPRAVVAAEFLGSCLSMLGTMAIEAATYTETDDYGTHQYVDADERELGIQLARSFCFAGLVDKFSPSGVTVEVSCVGNKIEGIDPANRFGLGAAIDLCVEEQQPESDETPAVGEPEPDPPAAPAEPPAGPVGQAWLEVADSEVEFVGCPDPNFPNVCRYGHAVTLDYATPVVPSRLRCQIGLSGSAERMINDPSGTVTLIVEYSVLKGRPGWDDLEVTSRCTLSSAGTENFVPVTADAVGERPDEPSDDDS